VCSLGERTFLFSRLLMNSRACCPPPVLSHQLVDGHPYNRLQPLVMLLLQLFSPLAPLVHHRRCPLAHDRLQGRRRRRSCRSPPLPPQLHLQRQQLPVRASMALRCCCAAQLR
jgi:hypothetical protein